MKKNIIITTLITMLFVSSIILTGCGNPVKGTWYYIPDASEASYENFEFGNNNEVINEGVRGKYEVSDDQVTVDFFGIQRTYDITEYEGIEVLSFNGRAVWARTLEGAKELNGSK